MSYSCPSITAIGPALIRADHKPPQPNPQPPPGHCGLQVCGPAADGAGCHQAVAPSRHPDAGAGERGDAAEQV